MNTPSEPAVYIRAPEEKDQTRFIQAVKQSQGLHYPWVSSPATPAAFKAYINRTRRSNEAGFLVCRHGDDQLCGVINLNIITYDALCSAYLGYYALAPFQQKGYLKEGLQLVIKHAFDELSLHRLEANIQPGNQASIGLVQQLGFQLEGFSPRYLKVMGEWRDHERWALLN